MTQHRSLRQRLVARKGEGKRPVVLDVPVTGRIDNDTVARLHELAVVARSGETLVRDQLYFSLQKRLDRIGRVLRPWPNTVTQTGIWERDDVRQESWIVFVELLDAWDEQVSFVPYLLARFAWRLRDRILRGIGKSQTRFGRIRLPESMLADLLVVGEEEQPESVAMARKLLEELIRRHSDDKTMSGEYDALLDLVFTRNLAPLVSPEYMEYTQSPARRKRVA